MPSFLELVFTFKSRSRPLSYAIFRHENYLEGNSPEFSLPSRGRSGILMQHAFNLLSVEKSDDPEERNQWPMRHASMYHSLDVETGRCVWMLFKGNTKLTTRVAKASEENRHLRPDAAKTREKSLAASLQVHLIMLEWCAENWGEYIDHMEETVSRKSVEAKVAPVAAVMKPLPLAESFARQGTMRSLGSRQATFRSSQQVNSVPTAASPPPTGAATPNPRWAQGRTLSGFLRRQSGLGSRQPTLSREGTATDQDASAQADLLEDLESRFSFGELQRLNLTGDEIDRSIAVMEQNKEVVAQIREQYESVVASHAFTSLMDATECQGDLTTFFRRVRSIERNLDVHHRRLKALCRAIDNDKQMVRSSTPLPTQSTRA
jgi:hypothetical protein